MRYQSYFLAAHSMGLRLTEALEVEVQDTHAEQKRVHIRLDKGNKDRHVILPNLTLQTMRRCWATHRNPRLIFPSGVLNSSKLTTNTQHLELVSTFQRWQTRRTLKT